MPSFNKTVLIGNLAADPETRDTKNKKAYTSFALATNRIWLDKKGQKQTDVDFHRIVSWNKTALIAGKHLKKGMLVVVDGRINNRIYELEDGKKGYITEITADSVQILDWKDKQSAQNKQHKSSRRSKVAQPVAVG